MDYIVYILECSNGAFYTGYTTDLSRRYKEHLSGTSKSKFTRSFPPQRIAASWQFVNDKPLALRVEKKIKSLNKAQKSRLIAKPETLMELLE